MLEAASVAQIGESMANAVAATALQQCQTRATLEPATRHLERFICAAGQSSDLRVAPLHHYRGTSLTSKITPLGPYRRPMHRVLRVSQGGGHFLMGEVPLYRCHLCLQGGAMAGRTARGALAVALVAKFCGERVSM